MILEDVLAFAGKGDTRGGTPPPQPTATPLHGPRSTHAMESQQRRFTIIMNKDSHVQPIVSPFPGVLKQMSFRKTLPRVRGLPQTSLPCFSPPQSACTKLAQAGVCPEPSSLARVLGSNRVE